MQRLSGGWQKPVDDYPTPHHAPTVASTGGATAGAHSDHTVCIQRRRRLAGDATLCAGVGATAGTASGTVSSRLFHGWRVSGGKLGLRAGVLGGGAVIDKFRKIRNQSLSKRQTRQVDANYSLLSTLSFFAVELFTIFDWITPINGFIEDIINDPTPLQTNSWTFFIPYGQALGSGWNAGMIERVLDQHGIDRWGGQITNGQFFLSVPRNQARWAEYLLTGHNIPVDPLSLGAPEPKQDHSDQVFTVFGSIKRLFEI